MKNSEGIIQAKERFNLGLRGITVKSEFHIFLGLQADSDSLGLSEHSQNKKI
jgi:hypothetical protein